MGPFARNLLTWVSAYVIELRFGDGRQQIYKGDLTILKQFESEVLSIFGHVDELDGPDISVFTLQRT